MRPYKNLICIKHLAKWYHSESWIKERDKLNNVEPIVPIPGAGEEKSSMVEKWESQVSQHEECYRMMRLLAQANVRILTRYLAKAQQAGDVATQESMAFRDGGRALVLWSKVMDLAIRGERLVTGAEYFDLNKAIALIRHFGYDIILPTAVEESAAAVASPGLSLETSDRILTEALGVELN